MDTKTNIELWIKDLGYKFNHNLYSEISKISYYSPSYKVMADIILKKKNKI